VAPLLALARLPRFSALWYSIAVGFQMRKRGPRVIGRSRGLVSSSHLPRVPTLGLAALSKTATASLPISATRGSESHHAPRPEIESRAPPILTPLPARGVENPHSSSRPIRSRQRAVSRCWPVVGCCGTRKLNSDSLRTKPQPEKVSGPQPRHAAACAEPLVGGCIGGDRAWRMNPPPDRGGRVRYGAGSAAFPLVVDPTEGPAGASVRAFFPAPEGGGEPSAASSSAERRQQQRYGAEISLGHGMHRYHQFGVEGNQDGGTSGSLPRHSSSPPGFFSSPVVDNGKEQS
jgi:hypothetical protein